MATFLCCSFATHRTFISFLSVLFLLLLSACTSEIRFDGEDNFVFAVPFSMLPMTIDESDWENLSVDGVERENPETGWCIYVPILNIDLDAFLIA